MGTSSGHLASEDREQICSRLEVAVKTFQGVTLLLFAIAASACAFLPAEQGSQKSPEIQTPGSQSSMPSIPSANPIISEQVSSKQATVPEPGVIWERRGGRMRTCQIMTIVSTSQVHLQSCQASARPLIGELDIQQSARLASYLAQYGSFTWSSPPQKGLADAFVDRYTFNGLGNKMPSPAEQGAINTFLAQLASSIPAPTPSTENKASGIEGQVMMNPACPGPVDIDHPCPDIPWQGSLLVLNAQGQQVGEAQTDPDGYFKINLPPGAYTLRLQSGGPGRTAPAVQAVVQPGQFTVIDISLDSGMR
jgi:hypothetical protein